MAFWVTYDHAGKLLLANLVVSVSVALPLMFGAAAYMTHDAVLITLFAAPLLFLAFCAVMPVMAAGMAHMVKEIIDTHDGSLRTLFEGIRLYWRRAIGLGLIYGIAAIALTSSAWFYASRLRASVPWLGYGLSTLALWCLAFLALNALLVIPTLVQKRAGVRTTLRLTAMLVLDNLLLTVGLALTMLALGAMILLPPLFFFLYAALAIVIVSCAYELLARKYDARAAAQQQATDTEHINTLSAARDTRAARAREEYDEYLDRGFRDFLFPWKE